MREQEKRRHSVPNPGSSAKPIEHHGRRLNWRLDGEDDSPVIVLVNGLTQYAELWAAHREALVAQGFRVATFDMFGQGRSDKPALFISQEEQVAALDAVITATGASRVFVAGISFGGLIALRHAIAHGERLHGLVAMSTFANLSPQLRLLGTALLQGLALGGISYLQDLLLPMNLSDVWLEPRLARLDEVKRAGLVGNDLFALQNLMESFLDFRSLVPDLGSIRCPTLILNGEYDFLTPRTLHEEIRRSIADSELVIVPRAFHAFTLEQPTLTAALLAGFAHDVLKGDWRGTGRGGGRVGIASEAAPGEITPFPAGFDHLRAIPVPP
ncbi:MAG: alpha/beta fold hydrolase [Cupriavidus sp.]|jgi:3-oxoadipate enol-lactonase|uniref:alpha/beta fold hydrolase n=1 Tax=Cupriavidus sp. TaxID=1873897 RepID=UPI0025C63F3D|nr:alpha/beta hydrolase [Cupriavidus sp.]MCA3194138.1 alpha/beta fold hydrolase [Cupriavidus sp.]